MSEINSEYLDKIHSSGVFRAMFAQLSLASIRWVKERRNDPKPLSQVELELETCAITLIDAMDRFSGAS